MSEKQIQAKCVLWFSQEYPERRGDLIGTFQETTNAVQGGNMLSLGLIGGVSDLLYFNTGVVTGIEMKAPDTYHDTIHVLEQCRFILNNCYDGWFCTSLEMFKDIINKTGRGIDALDVLDLCIDALEKKIELKGFVGIEDLLFEAHKYKKRTKKSPPKVKF